MYSHPAAPFIAAVTGLVMIGWIIWGIREYRRTKAANWLWMVILMVVSLTVVSTGMLR